MVLISYNIFSHEININLNIEEKNCLLNGGSINSKFLKQNLEFKLAKNGASNSFLEMNFGKNFFLIPKSALDELNLTKKVFGVCLMDHSINNKCEYSLELI